MPRIRRSGWFEATATSLLAALVVFLLADPGYIKKFARSYSRPKRAPISAGITNITLIQVTVEYPQPKPLATTQGTKTETTNVAEPASFAPSAQETDDVTIEFSGTNTQVADISQQPIAETLPSPVAIVYPVPPIQPYVQRKPLIDEITSYTLDPFFKVTLFPVRVILHPFIQDANSGRLEPPQRTPNHGGEYRYQNRPASTAIKHLTRSANHK